MNDNENFETTLSAFADNLAEEVGIDIESSTKVINWLVAEGVLDFPVVEGNVNAAFA